MEEDLPPYLVPHSQEPIRILYRDQHLLIVRKPHLLLSVPGRHRLNKDCLVTRLQRDYPGASMVHRLDLDTSGIMVVPLDRPTHAHISRQFQERLVYKQYEAVVWGVVEADSGEINLPIVSDWERRPLQKICHETGREAITWFEVLERGRNRTRLQLTPQTGRSHQLRIHCREIGHPILGCDMYAHPAALALSPRLLLHATELGFTHPATGVWLQEECPADF